MVKCFHDLFQLLAFVKVMKLIETFRQSMYKGIEFRLFERFLFREIERADEVYESECLCTDCWLAGKEIESVYAMTNVWPVGLPCQKAFT